jgi:two-component system phosphate regulon sensor histidine kinase PhoR
MFERFLPSTLRWRLAATYAALVIVLMASFGYFLIGEVRHLYQERLGDQLVAQTQLVSAVVQPMLASGATDAALDAEIKRLAAEISPSIEVIDASGRVAGDSTVDPASLPNASGTAGVADAFARADGQTVVTSDSHALAATRRVPGSNDMVVRVAMPIAKVDDAVHSIQRSVVFAMLLATVIAAAVAVWMGRRITDPLEAVRRQATRVARGDLESSVAPVMPRELADLATSFNAMTARVRELVVESNSGRARLEAIFANLSDGVVLIDAETRVISLNRAAAEILAADERDAVGRPFAFVARDADLVGLLKAAIEEDAPKAALIDYARSSRTFEASAQPISGAEEALSIVVVHDVTELRRLELIRREFVANVSHELRTPLASIRALVETLENGAIEDPVAGPRFMGQVVGEVDRLTELVDELLDLARLESGRTVLKREPIPAARLVRGAMERLRPHTERARVDLVADFGDDLPAVLADRGRIEQVLLNLIHNATKFTPAGGSITVTAAPSGESLQINVTDTGVGIPEADLQRVFERFFKSDKARRSEGTGLGLAIAKHIVQAHNGTIWVNSSAGTGSTFSFTLPLAEDAA